MLSGHLASESMLIRPPILTRGSSPTYLGYHWTYKILDDSYSPNIGILDKIQPLIILLLHRTHNDASLSADLT